MKNTTKGKILKGAALGIDVTVPLSVTLTQFPVWVNRDAQSTVSGLFLMLAVISCIPFYRKLKEYFKSPSAPVVWTILFVAFAVLENIAAEIKLVCFFGAIANYFGSLLYKAGDLVANREDAVR